MKVSSGWATDIGAVREINEDSVFVGSRLWVVADGMGGHAAGEVASGLAIAHFAALDELKAITPSDIVDAIVAANSEIWRYGLEHRDSDGLGTTVTGVALTVRASIPHWAVFNVGDSRVYHLTNGVLNQLSIDHSVVAEMVATGALTAAAALTHPARNMVTRSLGAEPRVSPDIWLLPVSVPEAFLICSDGLSNELSDTDILGCLKGTPSPQTGADSLVSAAVAAGGHDNVTAVIVAAEN